MFNLFKKSLSEAQLLLLSQKIKPFLSSFYPEGYLANDIAVDKKMSEAYIIASYIALNILQARKLINAEGRIHFVKVFYSQLSGLIDNGQTNSERLSYYGNRIEIFSSEMNDVFKSGHSADPLLCVYSIYCAPMLPHDILTRRSLNWKSEEREFYYHLKNHFVAGCLQIWNKTENIIKSL